MSEKPYLLLDVDGVVNVFPEPLVNPDEHRHVWVDGVPIWYSPSILHRLVALADRIEILWLTTWRERARDLLAPSLGLPHFQIVPHDIRTPTRHSTYPLDWWKLDAAEDLIANDDRPVIWCDDDLEPEIQAHVIDRHGRERFLFVNPQPRPGLDPSDVDRIEAFVSATK